MGPTKMRCSICGSPDEPVNCSACGRREDDQPCKYCGECGSTLTLVRPGKYQCDACDIVATIREQHATIETQRNQIAALTQQLAEANKQLADARQGREVERLRNALREIDQMLRVPAAEYVPAISDVFTVIDRVIAPALATLPPNPQ